MIRALFRRESTHPDRPFRTGWLPALVAGAFAIPGLAQAQEETSPPPAAADSSTHLVRTGDTLWEIARIYLGDPFLWPEIYRVNAELIEDPHWIFPGQALRVPAGLGDPTVIAEAPTDQQTVPQPQQPSMVFAPAARGTDGPTVFSEELQRRRATNTLQRMQEQTRSAIRRGEFRAAPWVDRDGGPRGTGVVVRSTDMPASAAFSESNRYGFQERLYILPPEAGAIASGDRYLTYRPGPEISGVGQVMIPTGIIVVEEAHQGERTASVARVVQMFDVVKQGDRVMPLEPFDVEPGRYVGAADPGITGRVVWMPGEPVLASIQQYLVLDASSRDGVQLGDQLTLVRPGVEIDGGVRLPEQEIAIAQVVRVTEYGVTAIVLDQTQPAIRPGTLARVTGRLP